MPVRMPVTPAATDLIQALIDAAVRGQLSKSQARRLYRLGAEAVTLVVLAANRRVAEQAKHITEQAKRIAELESRVGGRKPSPSTPSGMVPTPGFPFTLSNNCFSRVRLRSITILLRNSFILTGILSALTSKSLPVRTSFIPLMNRSGFTIEIPFAFRYCPR